MTRQTETLRGVSERQLLEESLRDGRPFETRVTTVQRPGPGSPNPAGEDEIGRYCADDARHSLVTDVSLADRFGRAHMAVPSLAEAGPRRALTFDPGKVHAAILTTGGIAPGLHSVVHAIVQRHYAVYGLQPGTGGRVTGVHDGFRGLCRLGQNDEQLTPELTEAWLGLGGSQLGTVRYYGDGTDQKSPEARGHLAAQIALRLRQTGIDVLYVLGGDGSMRVAHEVAALVPDKAVVCIPKTMDDDILWVSESFGFSTAVEEATRFINTLHDEAGSTRRICIVELFGAESGFVAASAALASRRVDLVLVPEIFAELVGGTDNQARCQAYWNACIEHVRRRVRDDRRNPHALIVIAEGVTTTLKQAAIQIDGRPVPEGGAAESLHKCLHCNCVTAGGDPVEAFINQPRHNIRAVVANAHDQLYCGRLGALAVDCALAGYTDFMVSQWVTEYVMVPLVLAIEHRKSIPLDRMFWMQVTNSTGQPRHTEGTGVVSAAAAGGART